MSQHIYADNAATTKLEITAYEAMIPWLLDEYGNASQPYAFSRKPKKVLAEARATIASCIGALPDEIYFTSGGTESDNWVIKSLAFDNAINSRNILITSTFEHHAVLNPCTAIERFGCPVYYMSPSKDGYVKPTSLENLISNNTKLVSVMLANNEIGSVQPIQELCSIAHAHGALFHTDAVQAVGHIDINVRELDIDFLSASAHKFNGPKGVGFLFIRKGIDIKPFLDGGAQEHGYRAGTENIASIVGMSMALKSNYDLLNSNIQHILNLEKLLIARLNDSKVVYKRNGGKNTLPGLLSLSFPGEDGESILHRMDLMGISISTGSACDSVKTDVSHVLKAIDLDRSYAKGTIRISLGKNNTREEVERIADSLIRILQ